MTTRVEELTDQGQKSHQDDVLSLMLIREDATELENQILEDKDRTQNADRSQDLMQVELVFTSARRGCPTVQHQRTFLSEAWRAKHCSGLVEASRKTTSLCIVISNGQKKAFRIACSNSEQLGLLLQEVAIHKD